MYNVYNKDTGASSIDVVLVSLLLTLNIFHTLIYCLSTLIDFEQVNAQWLEGSIILVSNDLLPRKLQLKNFCNMLSNCKQLQGFSDAGTH